MVLDTAAAILINHASPPSSRVDGDDALRKFRVQSQGFVTVLFDLTMPGLDGAAVLRIIRQEAPKVPAIVMSGFSEQDVFDRIRRLGEIGILRKPFTREMLVSRLASITG